MSAADKKEKLNEVHIVFMPAPKKSPVTLMEKLKRFIRKCWPYLMVLNLLTFDIAFGQSSKGNPSSVHFIAGTNIATLVEGENPNLFIGIGFKWLELNMAVNYKTYVSTSENFLIQYQEHLLNTSFRVFPFNRVFNRIHKRTVKAPCFSFKEKQSNLKPNGPYLRAGYIVNMMQYNFIPDSTLDSPIEVFPVSIKNNGVQTEIGYQLTLGKFAIGFGYGLQFTFPKVNGMVNPFGKTLYSGEYPFQYRIEPKWNLIVGVIF